MDRISPEPSGADAERKNQPRFKLMLEAEKLFAAHGIDQVSMRQIAAAAENGNNNAVQYYFKSKPGIIRAILAFRVEEMEAPRLAMLDQARSDGLLADAMTLLQIIYLPRLSLVDDRGRHSYASFLCEHIIQHPHAGITYPENVGQRSTAIYQVIELLKKRIAHVPNELALSRIALCDMMFSVLIRRIDNDRSMSFSDPCARALIDDTLEMMVAALCTPHRRLSKR